MRRFRRVFLLAGVLLAAVLLTVALLPWWLGGVLSWKAPDFGVTFQRYEKLSYSRFALHGVAVKRPGLEAAVSRVELDSPLVWYWRHRGGRAKEVIVGDWTLKLTPNSERKAPTQSTGWVPMRKELMQIASTLDRWLPQARTGKGRVDFGTGRLNLEAARWAGQSLKVDRLSTMGRAADVEVKFSPKEDRLNVGVRAVDELFALQVESRASSLAGDIQLWGQKAPLSAEFPSTGWLPETATFQAKAWRVAGAQLSLPAVYSAVTGDVNLDWKQDRFDVTVDVRGEPATTNEVPPLHVQASSFGNIDALTVQTLRIEMPGVSAHLSNPAHFEYATNRWSGTTQFSLTSDLAQQPWFPAKGIIRGLADIRPADAGVPRVELRFNAEKLEVRGKALPNVELFGVLVWPRLRLDNVAFAFGPGESLLAKGELDFTQKSIVAASAEGKLRRDTIEPWWAGVPRLKEASFKIEVEGPFANPQHKGEATISELSVAPLNPLATALTWNGRGAILENFTARAGAGASELTAEGSTRADALLLSRLRLVRAGTEELALVEPATVRWKPTLDLSSLKMAAGDRVLELSGRVGPEGSVRAKARFISYIMFSEFITVGRGAFDLPSLDFGADWNRGPATFFLNGRAELTVVQERRVNLDLKAASDGKNVTIETLRATDREQEILIAQGTLPLAFHPGEAPLVRLDQAGQLAMTASSRPDAPFWKELAELSGLTLENPDLRLSFQGTWKAPTGQGHFRTAKVEVDRKRLNVKVPPAENIQVVVDAGRAGVVLKTFDATVAGQAVHAHGNISMEGAQWSELLKSPAEFALKAGELRIQIPDADLAAFATYLPAQVAPKGRLQLDATVSESGRLSGFLRVKDAATRPMGGLGVLQDIGIDVALDGRTVYAKEVTGRLGGQAITLTGKVDLPSQKEPVYDLSVKGTNVPFVRQAGLLLRGDLDLKLGQTQGGRPRVSGEVRMTNGLFLSDVRNFMPSGGRSSETRPPYFSVEDAPFNGWIIGLRIHGDRFLRMRTPVFNGVASMDFDLRGTLGTPRAIGGVEVNEGQIMLPFAAFAVQEGTARLTEENPTEPAISVIGTTRKYGYDLRLEITGTPATPNVVFSSSPPLDSEQVLLMVMAGETPRNEVNYTTQKRVTQMGKFLGQSLLNRVSGDPTKPDRLIFSSGERISRQGRETYHIEYQLNDRWALIGEYDEFDAYNVGAKWLALSEQLRREKERKKTDAKK